jgi:hypothetical protein
MISGARYNSLTYLRPAGQRGHHLELFVGE